MVALCSKADTGVGPSIASVTMDVRIISRFSNAATNKKKLKVQLLKRTGEEDYRVCLKSGNKRSYLQIRKN